MDGSICDCAVAPRGSTHDGAVPPAMVQSIETNDGGVIRTSVAAIHAERPFGGQMGFDQTVCENRRLSPGRCAVQFTVRRSPANGRKMSRIAPPRFEVKFGPTVRWRQGTFELLRDDPFEVGVDSVEGMILRGRSWR